MTKTYSSLRRMTRLSVIVPVAAIVLNASAAAAQSPLGSAQSFAVLGASTVTNTGATTITGDLGVSPGSAITGFPPGTVIGGAIHANDAVAIQAQADALSAYAALVGVGTPCPSANNLTGQDLGTLAAPLPPGVYCFNSSAQLTGTLYLSGGGPWIFQIASTLTTASNASVVVINGSQPCSGSNVFWAIGSSATLGTGTQFVGNILAIASITLTTSTTVDGSAIALNGAVTMDTNTVSVCGAGSDGGFPPAGAIKVTGGGQIAVPDPDNIAPNATGTGRATFGFNAQPDKSGGAKGQFNYVNHVNGLHVNGEVTDIQVIAVYPDKSPKTVRFSGTWDCSSPSCSFSVTVEDHGEAGTSDLFGIAVTGGATEVRSQRVISRGNIQFHKN